MRLPDILIVLDDCSYCGKEVLTMVISPLAAFIKNA